MSASNEIDPEVPGLRRALAILQKAVAAGEISPLRAAFVLIRIAEWQPNIIRFPKADNNWNFNPLRPRPGFKGVATRCVYPKRFRLHERNGVVIANTPRWPEVTA